MNHPAMSRRRWAATALGTLAVLGFRPRHQALAAPAEIKLSGNALCCTSSRRRKSR